MSLAWHCDGPSCDTWQRLPITALVDSWVSLTDSYDLEMHFCTVDCCMKWCAAHSEPTEVVA